MATIVPFEPRARPPAARNGARNGTAVIVIFPGVRYEAGRQDEVHAERSGEAVPVREPEFR